MFFIHDKARVFFWQSFGDSFLKIWVMTIALFFAIIFSGGVLRLFNFPLEVR